MSTEAVITIKWINYFARTLPITAISIFAMERKERKWRRKRQRREKREKKEAAAIQTDTTHKFQCKGSNFSSTACMYKVYYALGIA